MKLSRIVSFASASLVLTSLAAAQTTLFADNFDNGLAQWSATGLWHAQDETGLCASAIAPFPSPGSAAAFNNGNTTQSYCGFFTSTAGSLTTLLPISIPAGSTNARLRFTTYEETECNGANCGWDERFVSVSSDGGQSWANVLLGAREKVWYERYASLDDYRGMDVLLSFKFDPVDGLWNDFRGWFVDDVVVEIDSPATSYCTGKVSSQGCIPYVTQTGDVSLTGPDDLTVTGHMLVNSVASKLIWSRGINSAPFHGGTLCVAVPAARTTVTTSGGTPPPVSDCTGSYTWHFTHAYMASKGVLAGQTLYVQASTRDPGIAPPGNESLSDALYFIVIP
jgi:hypothetical protein